MSLRFAFFTGLAALLPMAAVTLSAAPNHPANVTAEAKTTPGEPTQHRAIPLSFAPERQPPIGIASGKIFDQKVKDGHSVTVLSEELKHVLGNLPADERNGILRFLIENAPEQKTDLQRAADDAPSAAMENLLSIANPADEAAEADDEMAENTSESEGVTFVGIVDQTQNTAQPKQQTAANTTTATITDAAEAVAIAALSGTENHMRVEETDPVFNIPSMHEVEELEQVVVEPRPIVIDPEANQPIPEKQPNGNPFANPHAVKISATPSPKPSPPTRQAPIAEKVAKASPPPASSPQSGATPQELAALAPANGRTPANSKRIQIGGSDKQATPAQRQTPFRASSTKATISDEAIKTQQAAKAVQMAAIAPTSPAPKAKSRRIPIETIEVASTKPSAPDIATRKIPVFVGTTQFTKGIRNRTPIDSIRQAKLSDKAVYYYTTLKNLKGQTITHLWEKDGRRIIAKPFRIGSDSWRTWSRIPLTEAAIGEITVSVVNEKNQLLAIDKIEVVK